MSRISTISERLKAVDLFTSSYREAAANTAVTTQETQAIERELALSITAIRGGDIAITAVDAQTLVHLSEKHGEKYTFQVVFPFVKKYASNVDFTVAFLTGLARAGEADKLRHELVQNLFKDILGDVIPGFDHRYREINREQPRNEFAKRRRFDYDNYSFETAEDQTPRSSTAENLAALFHHSRKMGLLHEIDKLADKIISQAPNANVLTFEKVFLPLLKQLPSPVEEKFEIASSHSYQRLFRTVLLSYINIYVKPAPQKPTVWERQPRGCGLYCEDYVSLDAFLRNPARAQAYFSVNGIRRDHIEKRLKQSYCISETRKDRSPYTLVVTKTEMEWGNAIKDWNQRCGVALKAIEQIGSEKLRGLFGEGWEDAVGLGGIKGYGGEESSARRPLGDLAQGKDTSIAMDTGMVKKAAGQSRTEIVDLTCE
ncbi:hypothetical protein P7C71_g2268, partial [Lecanoromycetidae sp. Uapishka_2]